jgi:hypothetical protein
MKRYRHDPNAPDYLRELVDAARTDSFDKDRRRLVAERLGIAPLAGPPPSGPVRKSSPASARPLVSLGGVVLTAIAFIGGTVTYVAMNPPSPAESPHAAVSLTVPAPPPPPIVEAPPTSIVEPPPAPAAEPSAMPSMPVASPPSMRVGALHDAPVERAPIAKPGPAADLAPKGGAGDLRLEIAALDRVRRAAEAGQPRDALALLDEYAVKFPAGRLREEALVLRIEALHASGDQTGTVRLAQQLLRDSPNTPYAPRVRSVLAKASRKEQ